MVEPFLWIALVVTGWRWLRRRRSRRPLGPIPRVGHAPPDAQPIIRPRLDDNGLATYSFRFPDGPATEAGLLGPSAGPRQ